MERDNLITTATLIAIKLNEAINVNRVWEMARCLTGQHTHEDITVGRITTVRTINQSFIDKMHQAIEVLGNIVMSMTVLQRPTTEVKVSLDKTLARLEDHINDYLQINSNETTLPGSQPVAVRFNKAIDAMINDLNTNVLRAIREYRETSEPKGEGT